MVGDFFEYALRGLPFGCVFALLAVGLVLNYKTSGVFNLAFSAQAYVSAAVFFLTRKEWKWDLIPSAVVAILVVGPLMGFLLDRVLYRYLRTASPLAKLITSLGLLIAIPEMVKLAFGFGSKPQNNPPLLWNVKRSDQFIWPANSRFSLDAAQIPTILATIIIVIAMFILFRYSALGLRMRAVVESPRLAELQGVDAERVSMAGWMLSSTIAGLCGVLIAPLFSQLVDQDFFTLLVAALAAAVFGNLTSIPWTFVGGLVLGMTQAELTGFLPANSELATAVRPSLPFIVLLALVIGRLVIAKLKRQDITFAGEVSDPLAGVDPPPPVPVEMLRPPWMTTGTRVFGLIVIGVGLYLCWNVLDPQWLGFVVAGSCLGIIMLSMVMMTGVGGTVSLCQATFAAIGAFGTAQLVNHTGMSVLLAMLIASVGAAAVGAIVAIPVIRLPSVYAALATLAFAIFFERTLRPLEWVGGGSVPLKVPRPLIGSIDFADDRNFLLLVMVASAIISVGVILVRRGTTGRYLDALRGSPAAAASIGISPARPKLVAFVLSAGIAGFGGGLIASYYEQANYDANFVFIFGLIWLVMVVTAGSRSVQAALTSGITFFVFPKLLDLLFAWPGHFLESNPGTGGITRSLMELPDASWGQGIAFILFGIGAFTYAKHPEGIIEFQTTASLNRIIARVDRRAQRVAAEPAPLSEVTP